MTEAQILQETPPDEKLPEQNDSVAEAIPNTPKIPAHAYGALALGLIFIASAATTFEYFKNTALNGHQDHQTAGVAQALKNPFVDIQLQAKSAVVIDQKTGVILYSLNPDIQWPLASITKVAMALAVSEVLEPGELIQIPYDTTGNTEQLSKGETWRVKDIMNFTLIASSNAGSEILAQAANDNIRAKYPRAPQKGATLWRMNDLARSLGLTHTYFLNVSGLDMSATQAGAYGSARDLATLFAYAAAKTPETFAGTTKDGLLLTSVAGDHTSALNTNSALGSIPGLIMGKTGYTDLAGGNLAIVFDVGPSHPVVAVVLGSTEKGRFDDMKKLVAATEIAIDASY